MIKKIILYVFVILIASSCYAEKQSYKNLRKEKMEKFALKNEELQERKKKLKSILLQAKEADQEDQQVDEKEYEDYYENEMKEADIKHIASASNDYHCHKDIDSHRDNYVLPAWPLYSTRFKGGDYVHASVTYKNASKMFDDLGDQTRVAAQKFGCNKVTFGQIFLESFLIRNEMAISTNQSGTDPNKKNPFYFLHDVEICLDGHYHRVEGVIQYARQFWDNRFSVGIVIPIVYQQNTLKYSLVSTPDVITDVNNGIIVKENFGGDINAFLNHLLCLRGFDSKECSETSPNKTGLGDVSCSFQWNIRDSDREFVSVGARALFPTSQNQDVSLLWAPQLGNNGSAIFSGFLSAILLRNEILSPYLHGQIGVGASANQLLRAPKLIKYSGVNNDQTRSKLTSELVGSAYVAPENISGTSGPLIPFEGYDSQIAAFAGSFRSVRIAPGVMFDLMVGNVFSPSFAPGLTLDIFYTLHVKSMSSVQESGYEKGDWNLEPLVANSNIVDHHVGSQFAYQWQDYFRFSLKGGYSFAGRNNPAEIRIQGAVSVDF